MKIGTIVSILACCALLLAGCGRTESTPGLAGTSSAPTQAEASSTPEGAGAAAPDDPFVEQRMRMVDETIEKRGVEDAGVLRAMRTVPRHEFVLPDYLPQAYNDHPLPIGYGQTISQPYIVAWMTELIELQPGDKVLEIGTGSGYQAAVLAELEGVEVYSIEIVPDLAGISAERLQELGYSDVQVMQGDGYYGWPEDILFDAIIVTAAPDHVPAPLAAQLAEGGRMVVPIGPVGGFQTLWKFVMQGGELVAYNLGAVSFVPFTGPGVQQAQQTPTP